MFAHLPSFVISSEIKTREPENLAELYLDARPHFCLYLKSRNSPRRGRPARSDRRAECHCYNYKIYENKNATATGVRRGNVA